MKRGSRILSIFTFIYHHLFQRRGECNDVFSIITVYSLLYSIRFYSSILLFYILFHHSFSHFPFATLSLFATFLSLARSKLAPFSVFLFYFVQLLHAKIQSDFVLTNKVK